MLTSPTTLIFTVLPMADAGTRHFTEDADSNVIVVNTDVKSAEMILHVLVDLAKFGKDVVTVTFTACNRANVGIKMTLGIGNGGGGGAVDVGGAEVVAGGEGWNSIPN